MDGRTEWTCSDLRVGYRAGPAQVPRQLLSQGVGRSYRSSGGGASAELHARDEHPQPSECTQTHPGAPKSTQKHPPSFPPPPVPLVSRARRMRAIYACFMRNPSHTAGVWMDMALASHTIMRSRPLRSLLQAKPFDKEHPPRFFDLLFLLK